MVRVAYGHRTWLPLCGKETDMNADDKLDKRFEAIGRLFEGRLGSDKLWIWFIGIFCVIPVIGYIFSWPIRFIVFGVFKALGIASGEYAPYMAAFVLITSFPLAFVTFLYLWRMYDGGKNVKSGHTLNELRTIRRRVAFGEVNRSKRAERH